MDRHLNSRCDRKLKHGAQVICPAVLCRSIEIPVVALHEPNSRSASIHATSERVKTLENARGVDSVNATLPAVSTILSHSIKIAVAALDKPGIGSRTIGATSKRIKSR